MGWQFGGDVKRLAVGPVDPEATRVQVHLATDPAGQEGIGPAIFGIADDRMPDRRHVRAKLVGAPGERLELDPRRAIAGNVDGAESGPRGKAILLVDMHFLAAAAGLLGERGVNLAFLGRGHADHQRPIDFARGAAGEGLGEMAGGARRPRHEQHPRRVLVEPVDQLGAIAVIVRQPVEQAVEMLVGLGPALRREPRRLVEDQRVARPLDDHFLDVAFFLGGQRLDHPRRARAFGGGGLGGRHGQHLPGRDAVARGRLGAIDAKPPGPRPARHDVEARLGQVALEPAIEADAVVILGDGEGAVCGHGARLADAGPQGECDAQ